MAGAAETKPDGKSKAERAAKILEKGPAQLAALDKSQVFRRQKCREFPQFNAAEITKGPFLGKGGFSDVHEVLKIALETHAEDQNGGDEATEKESPKDLPKVDPMQEDLRGDDDHYDIETAREFMSKHGIRHGSSRYAIKELKKDLDVVKRAQGALDLAIEIKFLKAIWHPNIVKMRAYSNTPRLSEDTFILMDRLYDILDTRMEEWEQSMAAYKGCCGMIPKGDPAVQKMLEERMIVAYDISRALNYLHGLGVVYRDIKPENIGFDIRGDVKLFDFGLTKSLDPELKAGKGEYGYKLTKMTGSIPYMAPEVALGKPYGNEADVFSFGILLWEIISLDWAFNGLSPRAFFLRVAKENERLPFKGYWPVILKSIVKECWDADPKKRPPMKRVGTLIRGELDDMTSDDSVLNRTDHMMNRSKRSTRMIMESSRHKKVNLRRSSAGSRHSYVAGEVCGDTNGEC